MIIALSLFAAVVIVALISYGITWLSDLWWKHAVSRMLHKLAKKYSTKDPHVHDVLEKFAKDWDKDHLFGKGIK